MGIKRMVNTSFWNDTKVVEYFTPEDKYFMLYLLTNPHTTQLGIYEINKKACAFEMGYSVDAVGALLERFQEKHGIIIYSKETNEIAILNYLRYSIVKGGIPLETLIKREISNVKNKELLEIVFNKIQEYDDLLPTVKNIISYYYNGNENDNVNENENVGTAPVQPLYKNCTELLNQIKNQYGEYNNVFLTDGQRDKIVRDHSLLIFDKAIIKLGEYIQETGKHYEDHALTMNRWVIPAVVKELKEEQENLKTKKLCEDLERHAMKNL